STDVDGVDPFRDGIVRLMSTGWGDPIVEAELLSHVAGERRRGAPLVQALQRAKARHRGACAECSPQHLGGLVAWSPTRAVPAPRTVGRTGTAAGGRRPQPPQPAP